MFTRRLSLQKHMTWWITSQITVSLIGEYTHKEDTMCLQMDCSLFYSSNLGTKSQSKLCSEETILTLSRTTKSPHESPFPISDGAALSWLQCLRNTHKNQPIIWHILDIRSLSINFEGLWLQFFPCGLKNTYGVFLVKCGKGGKGNKSKEQEKNVSKLQ